MTKDGLLGKGEVAFAVVCVFLLMLVILMTAPQRHVGPNYSSEDVLQ